MHLDVACLEPGRATFPFGSHVCGTRACARRLWIGARAGVIVGRLEMPSDRSSAQWHERVAGRFELMAASWTAGDRAQWRSLYSPSLAGELPANLAPREPPGVAERDWDGAHQESKQWLAQHVNAVYVCGDEAAIECRYGEGRRS